VGNFLHVGAKFFAKIGDRVGIANFQREKRIRGVLNQLGAANGGHQKFRFVVIGTLAFVNGTGEFTLQDGAIDFAKLFGGGGILDAHNNAIGVEEILDGSAFA